MSAQGVRRTVVRAAVLAALAVPAASPALHAQRDTGLVDLVMLVRLERGPSQVMAGYARDSLALLPLRAVFDLAGLGLSVERVGERFVSAVPPTGRRLEIDLAGGRITRGDAVLPLARDAWVVQGGEPFVDAGALAWALAVRPEVSWPELIVVFAGTDSLPVVARALRDARRGAALQPAPQPAPAAGVVASRRAVDGALLDWSFTTSNTDPAQASILTLGFGGQVAGGSLELTQQVQSFGETFSRSRGTWTAVWPGRAWLRQVRLGDVMGAGPDPHTFLGGLVTNAPFVRSAAFGTDAFAGRVPPGWEAELYRFSRIVAYSGPQSTERFLLETPVSYGQNPMDLVLYGPHGEVVHRSLTVFVPTERLPAGRLEYALGGGRCRDDASCREAGNADLRYGLSRRVTAEAGVQLLSTAGRRGRAFPYGLVSMGVTPALAVTLHAALHGVVRARADLDPNPDVHLSLEQGWFDTSATAQYASRLPGRRRTSAEAFWRPSLFRGALFVTGNWTSSWADTTRSDVGAATLSVLALGARATLGLHRSATATRGSATAAVSGLDASLQTTLPGPGRLLRGMFVRGTVVTTCPGEMTSCPHDVAGASLSIGKLLFRVFRLDLAVRWQKGWRTPGYDVGVATTLPYMRAQTRNTWDPDFGLSGTESLEGSLRWDRARRRLELGEGRSLGRAGLTGVVFFDENANGVRDPGEPALPEVLMRVGSRAVVTDAGGAFRVFDLVPFEQTVLEVDSLSLRNPLWLPAEPRISVAPSPNAYQEVDIPVIQAAEVTGAVTWAGHENALSGLRVVFRNQATGQEVATATFSDGDFDMMGIRPGTYWVFLDLAQLDQLHVRSAPVALTIPRGGTSVVEGVALHIEFAGSP